MLNVDSYNKCNSQGDKWYDNFAENRTAPQELHNENIPAFKQ